MKAEEVARGTPEPPEDTDRTSEGPSDRRLESADDGRDAATHDRCVHHPGKGAVARCDACEQPVCLACAVPVRGRVLGPECLAAELGDPGLTTSPTPERSVAGSWVAVAGAVLAMVATVGPWTRTGAGDRLFGAWVPSVRWSMAAAVAAIVLLASAWWFRAHGSRPASVLVILAGVGVSVAAALSIAFPPTFQAASWGPWAAAVGGAIGASGAIVHAVLERRPTQGV
jgi:hypothetical protein